MTFRTAAHILRVGGLVAFSLVACVCAGQAFAGDRSADTEHARRSADSLKGDLDRHLQGRDAHYVRTWADYCTKDPERGGCDTVLRRLGQAAPVAKTQTDLRRDPSVDVRDSKAR